MEIIAGAVKNKDRQDPYDFKAVVVNGFNVRKLFVVSFWGAHFTNGQNWEMNSLRAESSRRTRDI